MRSPRHIPRPVLSLVALAGFLNAGFFMACSTPGKPQPAPAAAFEEGRAVFYRTVADEVDRHPQRGRLTPGELAKVGGLQTAYPRLYGILMNYYYQKDSPVFQALIADGSEESMRRFRTEYLDLARFSARMFAESLFQPSPHGEHFKPLIPRFKGKDAVDIVAMSAGHLAKLDLPAPEKIKPKALSPEFEKQWGLDAARFREAHKLSKGRGVRVAVLDSGIDMTHPVFQNTPWGQHFNFVGKDGFPWSPEGPPMVDWGWHGTVVTSIVAKYAPEAQITVYRYLDSDSQNDSPLPLVVTSLMGAALYKAVHDGNDVINLSAGSSLHVPYLQEACKYAYDNNVVFVTASPYYLGRYLGGNEDYPGQYPTNISVTGIDRLGENKYGYWEIAAPEPTTLVGSPNAPFVAYPTYVEEKDDYAPGISCATPIVASLVALAGSAYPRLGTEAPGAYVETIKKLLAENANPRAVGFDGFSPECGHGLIDAEKTVQAAIRLAAARPVAEPAGRETVPATTPSQDEDFAEGRKVFYGEVKLALGFSPERHRLLASEIDRIERGGGGVPFLYENLINILYPAAAPRFQELRAKNDSRTFRDLFHGLCREAARRFVDSLFSESPGTRERLESPPNLGRGRLDLVLASLGSRAAAGREAKGPGSIDLAGLAKSPVVELGKFREAWKISRGKGLKLAVIDSGWAFGGAQPPANLKVNHAFHFSLIDRTQAPWGDEVIPPGDDSGRGTIMAHIAALCAPDAEVTTYRIRCDPDAPYEYWPAMELAQAITMAARDGNDIIITGAAFGRDFPFLKEACRSAYLGNVLIFAPNGMTGPAAAGAGPAYPAAYPFAIAVAGAAVDPQNRPSAWALSSSSKSTAVTAPAFAGGDIPPSNAYAVSACGGLAALISPQIPRTGKELPGQYVQRIVEVLQKSADPKALGFGTFDPRIGYGLIDAERAVGPAARAYIKKMNELDESFKKRMAERAKQAEEAARQEAAEKEASAGKK